VSVRRIPSNNPNVYVGIVALFLFALQVASGVLLLLHYQSNAEHAYDSVARIAGEYPYGDLVRGVHFWSGHLLVAALLLQLVVSVMRGTFAAPRELVWLTGVLLATIAVGFAFTGSVLPWTTGAYVQVRVGSQMAGYVPLIGNSLLRLLRGGDEVTSMTLQQVYGFHIAVLPAGFTFLIALHFYLTGAAHRSAPTTQTEARQIPIYPDLVVRVAAVIVGVLVLVISLATFVARPLGDPADATAASPSTARPAWFFLPVHALLRAAPPTLLGVESARFIGGALTGLYLLVAALPFIDKRGSRVTAGITSGVLVLAALLTIHALN
jgi:ubiquinol-cytochrome c reductase cytochrome b subunit